MSIKIIESYKKLSVQVKATVWFTSCSMLQKGISFITIPVFTRLLTPEQYGMYSLYLSWLQILSIVTSLYLYYGVFNNAMIKYENKRDEYISSMQGLTTVVTSFFLITVFLFPDFWTDLIGLSPFIIVLMFVEMYVTPSFQFWTGKKRFEYKYKKMVVVSLSLSFLNPVLGLLLVFSFKEKGTARILSAMLTDIIICGILYLLQLIKGKKLYVKEYWTYALKMAVPLLPHYLSGMILNQGDRVMIDRMIGKSEVAYYSIAYSIGMLVQIVTTAVLNSLTPWMYQNIKEKKNNEIKGTINSVLLIVAFAIVMLVMFSPEMMSLFGSKEYASAVYVIPPVVASAFFIFLYNLLAIPQFYYEKTEFLMISSIIAALANIGLNFIFISRYGYYAAGYTTLVCYMLYCIGHYSVSNNILKEIDDKQALFDLRYIVLLSLLLIFICLGTNYLFDYFIVRVLIILLSCFLCVIKRNYIVEIIKDVRK